MINFIKMRGFRIAFPLVIFIALLLRLWNFTGNPPSLNWDEVSLGYNAYSILESGKDEWGKTLPIIFQAYGDYKLPVYVYVLAPFVSVFGLNEFSVRFPSVLAGTLTVALTYLIVKKLFSRNDKTSKELLGYDLTETQVNMLALISSFLVAVEPWSLFLSRPALEANLALCLFMTALYLFLRALSSFKYLPYSLLVFGLSVWTYNSYRIFTPLFLVLLFLLYKKELSDILKRKVLTVFCLLLTLLFFLPMFIQMIVGVGQERYKKVAIIDDGAIGQIVMLRDRYNFNPLVERLVFNRPTYFAYNFSKNMISHFSYKFLFGQGGSNYQFNIPNFGLLYKIDLIFLVVGIFCLIKKRSRTSTLLLMWLLLAAIPSSITREAPQVLRSITVLPVPMILSSFGLVLTFKYLYKGKWGMLLAIVVTALYFVILFASAGRYFTTYFNEYRKDYSWSWQYGYKQVIGYAKNNYEKYDRIIVTKKYGEPHEFFLFYLKWNPSSYQNDKNLIRFKQSDWFWVDRFDKFVFVNDWDIPKEEWQPFIMESGKEDVDCRSIRCLLITSPGNFPKTWNKLDTVNFLDGKPAFEVYEN